MKNGAKNSDNQPVLNELRPAVGKALGTAYVEMLGRRRFPFLLGDSKPPAEIQASRKKVVGYSLEPLKASEAGGGFCRGKM